MICEEVSCIKKVSSKIVNSERRLKERALKSPKNHATKPKRRVAVILLILRDSISQATPGSIKEIEELVMQQCLVI